jgi:hypothetical protein
MSTIGWSGFGRTAERTSALLMGTGSCGLLPRGSRLFCRAATLLANRAGEDAFANATGNLAIRVGLLSPVGIGSSAPETEGIGFDPAVLGNRRR